MMSWRFKSRKNKIGTVMMYIGLIGIILMITVGLFMIHWSFGIFIALCWLILIGVGLSE